MRGSVVSYVVPNGLPLKRRASSRRDRAVSGVMLIVFLLIGAACGAVGLVAFFGQTFGWYSPTPRVTWAPPRGVLQYVRATLLVAVAFAEWLIWRRRRQMPVGGALGLVVAAQVLSVVYPVVIYAGFGVFGLTGLWISVGLLLLLDLVVTGLVVASWSVSRAAAVLVALYLPTCLLSTALVIGSAGMHAVL